MSVCLALSVGDTSPRTIGSIILPASAVATVTTGAGEVLVLLPPLLALLSVCLCLKKGQLTALTSRMLQTAATAVKVSGL